MSHYRSGNIHPGGSCQDDPYEVLARAIITQACADWTYYEKKERKLIPGQVSFARDKRKAIERFFKSKWYGVLTPLDPDLLLERLREEVKT